MRLVEIVQIDQSELPQRKREARQAILTFVQAANERLPVELKVTKMVPYTVYDKQFSHAMPQYEPRTVQVGLRVELSVLKHRDERFELIVRWDERSMVLRHNLVGTPKAIEMHDKFVVDDSEQGGRFQKVPTTRLFNTVSDTEKHIPYKVDTLVDELVDYYEQELNESAVPDERREARRFILTLQQELIDKLPAKYKVSGRIKTNTGESYEFGITVQPTGTANYSVEVDFDGTVFFWVPARGVEFLDGAVDQGFDVLAGGSGMSIRKSWGQKTALNISIVDYIEGYLT